MADNNVSLVNINGLSNVAIKLLDMIEKAAGWAATLRGNKKDLEEALQHYKNQLLRTTPFLQLLRHQK